MTIPKRRIHRRKPLPAGQPAAVDLTPIHPNHFYRKYLGPQFFGLEHAALEDAIEDGVIPAPIPIREQGGRATGWFGSMILKWQAEKMEAASKAAAAKRKSGG
jgi:predicted DNA-binding transcriptional regulator AlpA